MIPENISLHHFSLSQEFLKKDFRLPFGALDLPKMMKEQGIDKLFYDFSVPQMSDKGIHYDYSIVMTVPISKIHSVKLSKHYHLEDAEDNPRIFSHTYLTRDGFLHKEKMTADFESRFQEALLKDGKVSQMAAHDRTIYDATSSKAAELIDRLKPVKAPSSNKGQRKRI